MRERGAKVLLLWIFCWKMAFRLVLNCMAVGKCFLGLASNCMAVGKWLLRAVLKLYGNGAGGF